jgi:hypothetical protein
VLDVPAILDRLVLLDELLRTAELILGLADGARHHANVELRLGKSPAGGEDQGQRDEERCFRKLSHCASFGLEKTVAHSTLARIGVNSKFLCFYEKVQNNPLIFLPALPTARETQAPGIEGRLCARGPERV